MRVLLISRCTPYPLHLGDRLIVYHLARALSARGHTLDLIALDDGTIPDERAAYAEFFDHIELVREMPRTLPMLLRRAALPASRFPRAVDQAWQPDLWRAVERRSASVRYDAAHVFGGVQVYEIFHALHGLPALITPYESYTLYLRRALEAAPAVALRLRLWMAETYERFMFAPYEATVVLAEADRAELLRLDPRLRVEVIPNGIDLEYFQPHDTPREEVALLFTGNFEYAPNVDAALRLARDVLPKVRAQIPQAVLWLVGNAPPPEIERLAGETVVVTGRVPDVRPYLARAAVFVSALTLGAGIKNKVLEALAMRCAVIATPVSVDGIAVEDGRDVLIVPPEQLAEAVIRALRDAQLRERLGAHGRALIEARYSWKQVAARYEALYAELTGSQPEQAR